MAGLGRKVFTAGDVLTASDLQSYAVDQSVMYFAGTAARSSAIATPTTGMTTYIGTTGTAVIPQIESYTGAAWQSLGGLTQVANVTVSAAASVTIDNVFTSAFQNYRIIWRPSAGSGVMNLETRTAGATNSLNYFTAVWGYAYTGATAGIFQNNTSTFQFLPAFTAERSSWICDVIDPKATVATNFQSFGSTGDAYYHGTCMFLNSASVDGVRISTATGTFSGSIRIYGYRNS
jgi:hypothetical protein